MCLLPLTLLHVVLMSRTCRTSSTTIYRKRPKIILIALAGQRDSERKERQFRCSANTIMSFSEKSSEPLISKKWENPMISNLKASISRENDEALNDVLSDSLAVR